ncbi:hypothetical protein YPPY34_4749, partial [Yersinia pestis PY-34]
MALADASAAGATA